MPSLETQADVVARDVSLGRANITVLLKTASDELRGVVASDLPFSCDFFKGEQEARGNGGHITLYEIAEDVVATDDDGAQLATDTAREFAELAAKVFVGEKGIEVGLPGKSVFSHVVGDSRHKNGVFGVKRQQGLLLSTTDGNRPSLQRSGGRVKAELRIPFSQWRGGRVGHGEWLSITVWE